MFTHARTLYAAMLQYGKQLTADIPDDKFAFMPTPTMNHPAWILGHLTMAADYGLNFLGGKPIAPEGYAPLFGIGIGPKPDRMLYPTKDEMLAAYIAGHEALHAAAANPDPKAMAGPNPVDFLKATMPTLGDFITHLLTTHEGIHLGQLSGWRRACGYKPINA